MGIRALGIKLRSCSHLGFGPCSVWVLCSSEAIDLATVQCGYEMLVPSQLRTAWDSMLGGVPVRVCALASFWVHALSKPFQSCRAPSAYTTHSNHSNNKQEAIHVMVFARTWRSTWGPSSGRFVFLWSLVLKLLLPAVRSRQNPAVKAETDVLTALSQGSTL